MSKAVRSGILGQMVCIVRPVRPLIEKRIEQKQLDDLQSVCHLGDLNGNLIQFIQFFSISSDSSLHWKLGAHNAPRSIWIQNRSEGTFLYELYTVNFTVQFTKFTIYLIV